MTDQKQTPVRYGLIGAGSFGQFCLQQYEQLDEVRAVAVADVNPDTARFAADTLGIEAAESADALLARDDIDLVHIATPPFTHRELAMKALQAGKHVLCEKPLATSEGDAEQMIAAARERGLVLSVNLIMRHDPLCEAVRQIVREGLLGEPLHGFFENYAKDEPLLPDHWFWKPELSGGIFIEHGVHFFDLVSWWLGPGEIACAQEVHRPGAEFIEQVHATVRYPRGVLMNFYHGFTQPTRMDRQEMRLVFERGMLRLFEWVPTEIELDFLADADTLARIRELLPGNELVSERLYEHKEREVMGRHKQFTADGRYLLRAGTGMTKPELYGHVLRSLLADQIAAIRNPAHERRITEENGYTSLQTAVRAQEM
ncbi:MAG: Gfo/Idh/MocA family protein, partial [Phycisphaeraceae bacterium]